MGITEEIAGYEQIVEATHFFSAEAKGFRSNKVTR
jgi:hypothetical protein